jgi:hypothetical protein
MSFEHSGVFFLSNDTAWRDIDFASMTVDVSPKKDRKETWEWHIKDTDCRTLPLTADLVAMLAGHQASQPARRLSVRPHPCLSV